MAERPSMLKIVNTANVQHELEVIQSMINISADRLERLRTKCVLSAELTQQEIRALEVKLVKMFSEFLIAKQKIPTHRAAKYVSNSTSEEILQWLRIVGKCTTFSKSILIDGFID